MEKTNAVSILSTRMLMVGYLMSGCFALGGEADALTLIVTNGRAGGKAGAATSVAVQRITINGIPGLSELTIPGALADQFVGLRAKAKDNIGKDLAAVLLTNPVYTVRVIGADGKNYTPVLNANASATAPASQWVTLVPAK